MSNLMTGMAKSAALVLAERCATRNMSVREAFDSVRLTGTSVNLFDVMQYIIPVSEWGTTRGADAKVAFELAIDFTKETP